MRMRAAYRGLFIKGRDGAALLAKPLDRIELSIRLEVAQRILTAMSRIDSRVASPKVTRRCTGEVEL